jgi:hypothetical protein
MKITRRGFVGAAAAGLSVVRVGWAAESAPPAAPTKKKEGDLVTLFNGKNLDGWYIFLRDPDKNPRPKNSDPEGVFKVHDGMMHVLGKEFGYVGTEREFDDFHLTVEFKWGEQKFPPRLASRRDSGILYRSPAGKEDKIWPHSIECQVQEGDCGDFWMLDGPPAQPGGPTIKAGGATQNRTFTKSQDGEKPTGEWNTIEVVADGGNLQHIVNGVVVNQATECSVAKGRIALQSEGAEVFYRKVELRPLA